MGLSFAVDQDKENTGKRKRAQSLGGEALGELRKQQQEYERLSPRKKARRSLVPGRSILKARQSLGGGPFYSEEVTETFNLTVALEDSSNTLDKRKSLSRRVSFAPTAHLREFVKDAQDEHAPEQDSSENDPFPLAQQLPIQPTHHRSHSRQSSINSIQQLVATPTRDVQEQSMELASDEVTAAFHSFAFPAAKSSLLEEEQPSFADMDESTMDLLSDPHAITSAFAQHSVIQGHLAADRNHQRESDMDTDGSSTEEEEVSVQLLGSGAEYEVPLGQEGVSVSSPNKNEASMSEEDNTGSTMDMEESMDLEATAQFQSKGLIVSDGITSRRISVGGTIRRGSLAPGHAALALLDAVEEDSTIEYSEPTSMKKQAETKDDSPLIQREVEDDLMIEDSTMETDGTIDMDTRTAFTANYENPAQPRISLVPSATEASIPLSAKEDNTIVTPLQTPSKKQTLSAPSSANRRSPGRVLSPITASPGRVFSNEDSRNSQQFKPPSSLAAHTPERLQAIRQSAGKQSHIPLQIKVPGQSLAKKLSTDIELKDVEMGMQQEEQIAKTASNIMTNMTLEDFFALTNTQFMDDVFSAKRKSMHQGSHGENGETTMMRIRPSFADQIVAMGCLVHDLEMYYTMSKELRRSLLENTEWTEEIERILQQDLPPVFKRYQSASEQERNAMETRFHIAKSHFRMEVKNEWYQYRSTAVESVCQYIEDHVQGIEEDRHFIKHVSEQLDALLPDLEAQKKEREQQLAREEARQAEIETCDPEHLSGLKEAITEQNTQIEDYARECTDVEDGITRLRLRVQELEKQKQQLQEKVQQSQQSLESNGRPAKANVLYLQNEYEALQDMHSWKLLQFNAQGLKLLHANEICVVLTVNDFGVNDMELSLYQQGESDDELTHIKAFLFDRVKSTLEQPTGKPLGTVVEMVRRITSMWSTVSRVLEEFALIQRRFPLKVQLLSKKSRPAPFLRVAARAHCDTAGASFFVQFELTGEEATQSNLNMAISEVGTSVEVQFGQIDTHELTYIVRERVSRGGPLSLLEACMQAESRFS